MRPKYILQLSGMNGGMIVNQTASDAQWFCRQNEEEERFYKIFFHFCRKYHVSWAGVAEKEKAFIEEITRVTYERDRAQRHGFPTSDIRPAFAS